MKQGPIRASGWSAVRLIIAASVAAAIFLWTGIVLAIAFVVLAALSLLPTWIRRRWTRRSPRDGPLTIEGDYTKEKQ